MRLLSAMRPYQVLTENPDDQSDHAKRAARLLELRIGAARKVWTEIEASRLEPCGPGWLRDTATDLLYQPYRGATFPRGSAYPIADRSRLTFYLDGGEIAVIEPVPGATWSSMQARLARRT